MAGRRRGAMTWVALALGAVAVLVVGVVVGTVVDGRRGAPLRPAATPPSGSLVPAAELAGRWAGQGALDRCAGFEQGCQETRQVTLSIDCAGDPCTVVPFDAAYGSPPLRVRDGGYRAAGPLPAGLSPTCGGAPTSSASWRLDLTVRDGRLVGSYAESTLQGFDCGATGVAWTVVLDRG